MLALRLAGAPCSGEAYSGASMALTIVVAALAIGSLLAGYGEIGQRRMFRLVVRTIFEGRRLPWTNPWRWA